MCSSFRKHVENIKHETCIGAPYPSDHLGQFCAGNSGAAPSSGTQQVVPDSALTVPSDTLTNTVIEDTPVVDPPACAVQNVTPTPSLPDRQPSYPASSEKLSQVGVNARPATEADGSEQASADEDAANNTSTSVRDPNYWKPGA